MDVMPSVPYAARKNAVGKTNANNQELALAA
jgi:hypothetical protein